MPKRGRGKRLAQILQQDNTDEPLEAEKPAPVAAANEPPPLYPALLPLPAEEADRKPKPIVDQRLSKGDKALIKGHRGLQKFVEASPYYIKPPGRPEHADLARYRDQYMSKHVKPTLASCVELNEVNFPAELLVPPAKRKQASWQDGGFTEYEEAKAKEEGKDEDSDEDGGDAKEEESDDDNEYTKMHGDVEGEDSVDEGDEANE